MIVLLYWRNVSAYTVWVSWVWTPVSISTAWAFKPSVSIANNWEYVVAWVKDGSVEAKIYNGDDTLKVNTITIDSNTNLDTNSSSVLVKMDPINWNWIVVYHKKPTLVTDTDLYYRVYNRSWTPLINAAALTSQALNQRNLFVDYSPLDEIFTIAYASEKAADLTKENIYVVQVPNSGSYVKQNDGPLTDFSRVYRSYPASRNHSFFLPAKNRIAANYDDSTNWALYNYTWNESYREYRYDNQVQKNINLANTNHNGLTNNNIYQNINNKMGWYSNKWFYTLTAGEWSCSEPSYSYDGMIFNNYYFTQGAVKSAWFMLKNEGWNAYSACRGNDSYPDSNITPSVHKVSNLFNGWIIGVFSPSDNSVYRVINVVYWDGIEWSTPTTVTYNLLGDPNETISAVDVNLYWKIITVKWD